MTETKQTGLDKAIEMAGSQAELARVLNVTPAAISMWAARGWVPWRKAVTLRNVYGIELESVINPVMLPLIRAAAV